MDIDKTEMIYGRQPVLEALRGFREVYTIYAIENALKWLKEKAIYNNINIVADIKLLNKEKLYNLIKHPDHQGIVAQVEKYRYTSAKIILDRKPEIILIADSITDRHNLGAMIRSANIFGVGAVIIPRNNSADINSVVVHSSAGATEHTPIVMVESINHFIRLIKEREYKILSAVKPSNDATSILEFKSFSKVAIIMGSEGKGVSNKTQSICDDNIYIPQFGEIDSFNVSVATGIILFQLKKRLL